MPATATAERVYRDLTVRTFEVRADSWDDKTRSFDAVIATETPVLVMDLQRWEPVEEILLMRGCKIPKKRQVPLLDSHNMGSVRQGQIGSLRNLRIEGKELVGRAFLASSEEDIAAKVREGHVTDISVGYRVVNSVTIEPGKTVEVEGESFTAGARALRVTTEWPVKEGSLCPVGADEDAKIREETAGQVQRLPAKTKEGNMPEPNAAVPAGAPATPPAAPAAAPVERVAPKVEELPEEIVRRRVMAITPHDLVPVAERLLVEGKTFDECRAAILAEFAKTKQEPVGSTEPDPAVPGKAERKLADVPDDVLRRSLCG